MEEIDVPSYFLCPISLQLMRDPVTVSTGITFDRESIEVWLFSCKSCTCPVTKQQLSTTDLTPNHNLRRLIQGWCMLNASHGVERVPTPKPQLDRNQIMKLLGDAKKFPDMQLKCLRRLRSIVFESERIKNYLEDAGAVEFLASIIKKGDSAEFTDQEAVEDGSEFTTASDEALSILYHLKSTESHLKSLASSDFFESLLRILRRGTYQSRAYATIICKSILEVADPVQLISLKTEFFAELVRVLRDQISQAASKAALKLLVDLCPWGRNRIKAVEGDAVSVLVELLLDTWEKRTSDLLLIVLDQLCGCAEGRAEMLKHAAGLAIVSKKILRVSHVATDRAVRILSSVSRYSATDRVVQEMLVVGVVSKLCLVLQVDSSFKAKERAREILKLHSRVWRHSACIPAHLLSSYPSSS